MDIDNEACYQALLTHDPRFDGVFFVGVGTTGIYCRTVCTAKRPKRESCTFYPSAAAAERAGYRPCLRCRPELAPGSARIDAVGRLAGAALGRIEDGALTDLGVGGLADELGVTDRHLRRVVRSELGVSLVDLAQTHRLLLAKRLLTDTDMSVTDVAFASGFGSLRRFNALFKERYRLRPGDLRRARAPGASQDVIGCEVAYRPPLNWELLLDFLDHRTIAGVEAVEDGRYLRTFAWREHRGWLSVEPSTRKPALRVSLSVSLAPALQPALARVKRLFDTVADPSAIAAHLNRQGAGLERREAEVEPRETELPPYTPGLRVPGCFDGFELVMRAILGQQVSVKAARTIAGRFAAKYGEPITTPHAGLTHLTPAASRLASATVAEVGALGVTGGRATSLIAAARALAERRIVLEHGPEPERTMAQLRELPGVGEWTAQYIAMRGLGWPDAFPHTDLGVRRALGVDDPRRVLEIAEAWRPWRAYAVMHLWTGGRLMVDG